MSAATLHQLTNHIAGSIRQAGILVSFCQDLASRISKMSNIKSLADLGGDESDHDDDHNDYYAGGEKSGQLIRGAPDEQNEDRVGGLFARARQHGAAAGTSDDLAGPSRSSVFQGQGRTLAGNTTQAEAPPPSERTHVIKFYRNNVFTVDDGPARRVDDPTNMPFMDSIGKGECPSELDPGTGDVPVTVNLLRVEEDYSEPERPRQATFTGTGRTLGGGGGSTGVPAASVSIEGVWEGVNESQPVTSLQLRLMDGSRMVARFNYSHTLVDVRRFIRASRPDMTTGYRLATGLPPQVVENEAQTLEAAGLLNAVLIQKSA